jgi:hypothetical protein
MIYSPYARLTAEVYGKLTPPNSVTNFTMVAQGDQAKLDWTRVEDLDVVTGGSYWIRYTRSSSPSWASSTDIIKTIPGNLDTHSVALMSGSYLIKALDSSGNESATAAIVTSDVADILGLNAVYTSTQNPLFGSNTVDKGVNDSDSSNVFYDSNNQAVQLDTVSLASGTHDAYYSTGTHEDDVVSSGTHDEHIASGTHDSLGTGTHDDARSTGAHNAILNSGSTEFNGLNIFDSSTGNFDSRSGSFDDVVHTTNKLEDDNASFDSTWLNNIIRNTTDNTTATVSSVDSSTRLTLSSDIFDGYSGDAYRLETKVNQLRDTTATFVAADVGRTVRNTTDGGTATISIIDSSNLVTLSTSLFANDHGDTWELEAGPSVLRDTGASFTSALVGRTVRNTTDNTTATVSSYTSSTELVLSSGIFDNKDTHSYDVEAGASKLYDSSASFTSSMVGNIVKNSTRSTNTTVSTYISATELTLASGIFDNKEGDSYTVNNELNRLRDTGASFTSALVGRTIRNTNDGTTTTVSAFVNSNELTLSSGIFDNKDGHVYEVEPGYDRLYDPTASFSTDVVGKLIRNTTDNTTATVSSRVDGTELVLSSGIFDNQDGEGYRIEVPSYRLRDTGASFTVATHNNRIIRNLDSGALTTVSSVEDSTTLVVVSDIFGQTNAANYKVEGDVLSSGYYYFTDQEYDLGQVYSSRITASYACNSFSSTTLFDGTAGNFDSGSGLFDGTDISDTNASLEISKTTGDPAASPIWTDWAPFFVGDYSARAVRFRLALASSSVTHNIRVDELSAIIDMPDTTKRDTGVSSNSGTNNGTKVILYSTSFKTVPTVGITMQNAASGDYYTISSATATGFTVTFYNSSNTATQKSFNWMSTGY